MKKVSVFYDVSHPKTPPTSGHVIDNPDRRPPYLPPLASTLSFAGTRTRLTASRRQFAPGTWWERVTLRR